MKILVERNVYEWKNWLLIKLWNWLCLYICWRWWKGKKNLGWCVVDDEDHEEDDEKRRKKMNNTNPNIFLVKGPKWYQINS